MNNYDIIRSYRKRRKIKNFVLCIAGIGLAYVIFGNIIPHFYDSLQKDSLERTVEYGNTKSTK